MKETIDGDRLVAFLIVNGKVYESDIDHQECLQEYFEDTHQESPYDWDCDAENFDNEHEEAMHQTYEMKNNHTAYGFDCFDAAGLDYVLLAHDKKTLDDNKEWAEKWAKDNETHLGYFLSGWEAEIVA